METERLSTIDAYGSRRFVIPAEVHGPLRRARTIVSMVLIFIFVTLPWMKLDGMPLLLLDISGRRFVFFGRMFFAHDSPLIFLVLASAALVLGAVTAVWGRVWCGWACPQTVFIDGVFRRIEIWIEGNYIERRKLRNQGLTWNKASKAVFKWSLYLVISFALARTFFALFGGAPRSISFATTALIAFNFGWFREQFCTIVCPYGRFQSVLMDQDSLTVAYDNKRPDCVSCNRCVEVCPAKIDIRQGLQMECIGCTACIDACNVIMRKVKKPEGLIRYQSQSGLGLKLLHPRALVYATFALLFLSTFSVKVLNHRPYEIEVLRAKDTPYQVLADGKILNHFKLRIFNQSPDGQSWSARALAADLAGGVSLTQAQPTLIVAPGQSSESHIFVSFPAALLDSSGQARLNIRITGSTGEVEKEILAMGPSAH